MIKAFEIWHGDIKYYNVIQVFFIHHTLQNLKRNIAYKARQCFSNVWKENSDTLCSKELCLLKIEMSFHWPVLYHWKCKPTESLSFKSPLSKRIFGWVYEKNHYYFLLYCLTAFSGKSCSYHFLWLKYETVSLKQTLGPDLYFLFTGNMRRWTKIHLWAGRW